MYDVIRSTSSTILEIEKTYGNFNTYPPNWVEITPEQFSKSAFFYYRPLHVEFRQMYRKNDSDPVPNYTEAILYFLEDGTGYAISRNLSSHQPQEPSVKYFKFYSCAHEYGPDIGDGVYTHKFICKKCGYVYEYDNSD